MTNKNIKDAILEVFDTAGNDYWKTIDEIAAEAKLDPGRVVAVISDSGDFVRSSYRRKAGQPLFTTRNIFRNKAPLVDKMIGAFKNRID
jgi:hypothetical protein